MYCMHKQMFFLNEQTKKHDTHTHTLEDSFFRRQIALIRDSTPCCHDNNRNYPKEEFCSPALCCPPPHPLGVCFQHNAGEGNTGTASHRADWSCLTRGERLLCTGNALWQQFKKKYPSLPTLNKPAVSRDNIVPVTYSENILKLRGVDLSVIRYNWTPLNPQKPLTLLNWLWEINSVFVRNAADSQIKW